MKRNKYISNLSVANNKICWCLSSICAAAGDHYAQLVFRSGNSDSLWSLKAIHSMCEMEQTQVIQIYKILEMFGPILCEGAILLFKLL